MLFAIILDKNNFSQKKKKKKVFRFLRILQNRRKMTSRQRFHDQVPQYPWFKDSIWPLGEGVKKKMEKSWPAAGGIFFEIFFFFFHENRFFNVFSDF